jgi:hypothetical protein
MSFRPIRQTGVVALVVTLRRTDGSVVRALTDPSGGTFDAAGDFDELLDSSDLPFLGAIDPYDDTTVGAAATAGLLADVDRALLTATGMTGRGLLRLRVMAELCRSDGSLTLRFEGD